MATENNPERRKGGRPPKPSFERVKQKVHIGLSALDLDVLRYRVALSGMKQHEFCHDALLHSPIQARIRDEEIELVRQLAGMGNNLNQIARKVNTFGPHAYSKSDESFVGNLSELIRKVSHGKGISD